VKLAGTATRRRILHERTVYSPAVTARAARRTCNVNAPRAGAACGLALALLFLFLALLPHAVRAQGGPPYITNDPGTPGNGNWEINIAAVPTLTHGEANYQLPQLDMNFGVGDRIQLTYQVSYVLASSSGQPQYGGVGNAFPGVKWRFLDQGENGWQLSIFPQVETGAALSAQEHGIGASGPRYLLPIEAAHKLGPIDLDFEVGYYVPLHGARERIAGLVAGHTFNSRFELDTEIYDDHAVGALPHQTLLDVGGRYRLGPGFIALFMAGRSINGTGDGQPDFFGYFGIQILLSHYGLALNSGTE
jgi:hypothetical protein